ncbi:MAG TPA: ATP-dependent Clp protease proteolytic subunit [Planctomycetota bacterium]|nr:ATP-dependent Clp protease proteolytic subunit [Planctomycetota bacterium]
MSIWIPTVIEKTGRGERAYDIYSRLLEDRIVFVGTPITDTVANIVIAQLLFLQKENKSQEISLYINSPGGYVSDGLAIYDTMQFITCDLATYCIGQAMSMGALLLAAGTKGKRFILPHARVMLHQPSGGVGGTAADIERHAEEIIKLRKEMNEIFSRHTGQPLDRIDRDSDRDFFLNAQEAKKYGLVDEVIEPLKAGPPTQGKIS